jgi:hypothetical protein
MARTADLPGKFAPRGDLVGCRQLRLRGRSETGEQDQGCDSELAGRS